MKNSKLFNYLSECEALLADGFDDALVGYAFRSEGPVALYDKKKCITILMELDNMSHAEAREFFEFNVLGAWVGDRTPLFASLVI